MADQPSRRALPRDKRARRDTEQGSTLDATGARRDKARAVIFWCRCGYFTTTDSAAAGAFAGVRLTGRLQRERAGAGRRTGGARRGARLKRPAAPRRRTGRNAEAKLDGRYSQRKPHRMGE